MNNIIFSNLTKKQILEAYKNKEYKKTIIALRNIFNTRNNFLKFLNENVVNLVEVELRKFREILYIWTVIEEFKKILNGKLDVITVAYMQEYEKDYVKEYFSDDEIKKIKKESNKYFIKQKNRLLLKNYEDGNFEYVMTSLKCDYKDYFDYEASIDVNNGMAYERSEIAPLRELSQIFNHTDFNKTSNNTLNYQYAMLKNLISIYKHMKIEYAERYLLRQKKIGVNIEECITNQDLLKLFNTEERTILSRIYKENVKNGLKVNKGIGLYNKDEYTRNIHTIMNILEIPGTITEKYNVMKFKYNYVPYIIKTILNSKAVMNGIKIDSLKKFESILNGYSKAYDDIVLEKNSDDKQKLGEELGRIITEFLDNNVDIDSYFNQNNLLKKEYSRILNYVSKYCPDIYERFINYRKERIEKAALMIVDAMKKNDSFTEIDYYAITNIPYIEIKNYLRSVNLDDYIMFNKFIQNNPNQNDLNNNGLKMVYDMRQSISIIESDGSSKIVEPTIEDKKFIVIYLKYIGAPITLKNISIGLKRLLSNKLYTEENYLQKRITL